MKRVVITGMGTINPLGKGLDEFWENLKNGKPGIGLIERFDTTEYNTKIAAEIKDYNPEEYLDKKEIKRLDRYSQYALIASILAVENGEIDFEKVNRDRVGVIIGTGIGGVESLEGESKKLLEKGPNRVSPLFIPMMISNMAAGHISMKFGLKGSSMAITTACASSTHAIGESFRMLREGKMDMVVTGGTEASITPLSIAGFSSMKALSTNNHDPQGASRPFDKNRDGFVMGEGAGILVLEELEHALSRNAKIYGEVVGYGATSDAYHITQPDENASGATKAMKMAIDEAGIEKEEVGYINAHGTSTYFNDKLETLAIKNVFDDHAKEINISSTKSMTGHLLGAAGAIEAIASIKALECGIIPPTINYTSEDEECDLNYTPNKMITREIQYALSNSLGFGGHNASLLFKKY